MPILLDMTPTRANKWEGQVYNSQNGKTYSANISLSDPNTLRIQGCVLGFLCGGESWTRVETNDTVGRAPAQTPSKPAPGGRTEECQERAAGSLGRYLRWEWKPPETPVGRCPGGQSG